MIGATVSHFLVERHLGAGGMATVYLARDLALARLVALKVVTGDVRPDLRVRLLREAEASARLQHPAIATFYEAGEIDGTAFIAMEYVEGETMRDRLGRGPLPVETVVGLGAMLLEALHHAHVAGLLHRDIKPENVMLTPAGTPKLLDFGLARAIDPDAITGTNLTLGGIAGTVGYMSPEQLHGEELDARSDLFAMGAVLYEMLVGRAAFPGTTMAERIGAILSRDPARCPSTGSRLACRASCCERWPEIAQVDIRPPRPSSRTGAGCPTGPPCNPGSRRRWPSWICATSPATRATSGSAAASPRASRRIWRGCPA